MIDKIPYILTLISLICGVSIAILFGINEDLIKNKIATDLKQNQKIALIEDPIKKEKVLGKEKSKNWRYYQRFHFHSTGIGAMSMGVLLLLSFYRGSILLRRTASYLISVGGLLYPFVWLFAGLYGPIMGRIEAKEAFAIFGYMGGLYLLGLFLTTYCAVKFSAPTYKDSL